MKVRIAGVGASVPPHIVSNEHLLTLFPGPRRMPWTAADFEAKTGIRERRFSVELDLATGYPILPPGYGEPPGPAGLLAEGAVLEALATANTDPTELDALIYGSATPDRIRFGDDAQLLHHRLGMRPDAPVVHIDVGCGGSIFGLQWAKEMILSGVRRRVAVVMVQVVSPALNREIYSGALDYDGRTNEAFLTALLFGDGAGAVVLERAEDGESEMLAAVARNEHFEIAVQEGGGNLRPPGSASASDFAVHILGKRVADAYAPVLRGSIEEALAQADYGIDAIGRFYFHQSNLRLVDQLTEELGADPARVAINVDRYGNTSGASTLILLAEEVRSGMVALGSGVPVVLAAVGANLQYGAHVLRL
ncbi:3-ketoacyl-ACP synthase [Nocardia panacis]|uniref:3-ketoacyl-ACP synthase n=1 Tax=Nocardia panacis TaxID=2340916 RepID=A0A3A4K2I2_9NOCA|nr:3-oxoacyl-[acyl-carrier-protein] synthase III C-terminal domain-containing protein [Nocardia panacis]RJO78844.1 3-ketoacyl-ACP synthase [Nocardia panacis]